MVYPLVADNQPSINDYVPEELFVNDIFEDLSPKDLVQVSQVCKKWHHAISNPAFDSSLRKPSMLTKLFPWITVKDKVFWEEHVDLEALGPVEDEPVFNKNIEIPIVEKLPFEKVEGRAGFTRLTIFNNFIFNVLEKAAKLPKQGNPTEFTVTVNSIREKLNKEVVKTRVVYISNDILEGTRNKDMKQQLEILREQGCKRPDALTVIANVILTRMSSEKGLSTILPNTYMHTTSVIYSDTSNISSFVIVGDCFSHKLWVDQTDAHTARDDVGAGGFVEVPMEKGHPALQISKSRGNQI